MSIRELREAVEAGTATLADFDAAFPPDGTPFKKSPSSTLSIDAGLADNGSLDAAKRLHDALFPGWVVRLTAGTDQSSFPYVHVFKPRQTEDDPPIGANSSGYRGYDPARAWLIAILRALEQEGRDG